MRQKSAEEVSERGRGLRRRPRERLIPGEDRLARLVLKAGVDMEAASGEVGIILRHEGQAVAGGAGDLFRGQLVENVPIGHLERRGVAQIDLVLAGTPFSLAELDGDRRSIDAVSDRAEDILDEGRGEDVIVLHVPPRSVEPSMTTLPGVAIAPAKEEELELAPHRGLQAALRVPRELTLKDSPRRHLHGCLRGLAGLQPGQIA